MFSSVLCWNHAAFHLHIVFVLPHAVRGSGHRNALDVLFFFAVFSYAASGLPFPDSICRTAEQFFKQHRDGCKIGLQPVRFPTKISSFSHLLKPPCPHLVLASGVQDHRFRKEKTTGPWPVSNFTESYRSPRLLCSPKVLYQMCCYQKKGDGGQQNGCKQM